MPPIRPFTLAALILRQIPPEVSRIRYNPVEPATIEARTKEDPATFRRGSADGWKCPVRDKQVTHRKLIALLLAALAGAVAVFWIMDRWPAGRTLLVVYWPLVLGCLVVAASLLEIAWWLRMHPWYYRTGPKVCGERWQTAGADDQLREAIRPVLNTDAWVGREASEGFFLRRMSLWHFGSRVLLRLEDADHFGEDSL